MEEVVATSLLLVFFVPPDWGLILALVSADIQRFCLYCEFIAILFVQLISQSVYS